MGSSCPNYKAYVEFCDICDSRADYFIDGKAYCKECAKECLAESFENMSVEEKANMLQIDYRLID